MTIDKSGKAWKAHVRSAVEWINDRFPQTSAGTYGGHDPDISLAADFMIPGYQRAAGIAMGDRLAKLLANVATAKLLGIWYVIWRGRIWSMTRPASGWLAYHPDPEAIERNADSAYHRNHVHVSWYPKAPTVTYLAPYTVGAHAVYAFTKAGKVKKRAPGYRITTGTKITGGYLQTAAGYLYPLTMITKEETA